MGSKKRRRRPEPPPAIHPRNKYAENPPDFALLASLYPSFEPFVSYGPNGRARIDWTDFSATRELTRILLHHDHHLSWWIPDGQLCPTVPNRSNYIHWMEDLLSSTVIPRIDVGDERVRGFDIGTGANCIYPLLGASLLGWSFVGSDVTEVALEWAKWNVESNPHISDLIEIRKVDDGGEMVLTGETDVTNGESAECIEKMVGAVVSNQTHIDEKNYYGPPILVGVVKDDEKFDFCMCNPPFFESISEAGLNPKTSCGGTCEEMVCPGGERAFITQIIEDSVLLKGSFRWFSSMVGKKANLKYLVTKLREVGVTIVKTTEFVQGQTYRWGLAWSFLEPTRKILVSHVTAKSNQSFMLEGLHRHSGAIQILKSVETFFVAVGAICKTNSISCSMDITASDELCHTVTRDTIRECVGVAEESVPSKLSFRISLFEQIPGTFLVKGSLQHKQNPHIEAFSSIFCQLEETLRNEFGGK